MTTDRKTVAVAICTYNRHGPLVVLLDALRVCAARVNNRARVGVVIVDDSSDGNARPIVERYEGSFELGIHYARSGKQNISLARNLVIETAAALADWVAMTDDDCRPCPEWLEALLDMQERTGADAIAGKYTRCVPAGSPSWLTDEPFLGIAIDPWADGAAVPLAGTNNSMLSSRWWKEHPDNRFRPAFGVIGGEDVVFYRTAYESGLRIHFARRAEVFEEQPPARTSLSYQLWHFFWLGNGGYFTRSETGQASPLRMFLQGGNEVRKGLQRPIARMMQRERPQVRYGVARVLFGIGMMIGPFGIRIRHH